MKIQRFELALERLHSEDWARFESFASQFLVFDYGSLRSLATNSGDLGRDAQLFSPEDDTAVLMQYSVSEGWATKIRKTASRIRESFSDVTILIYVTNQKIGAKGDALKKEIRKDYKLILDILDRAWFLDRMFSPVERLMVAESLAKDIVDPFLASREVVDSTSPALTEFESKAAVLHLQLQWEDDSREKGLTKLCYEGLVKSVLRETSSEMRLTTQAVQEAVRRLLPDIPPHTVDTYVNSALDRLHDKKVVKRWRKEDGVCLSHDEVLRVREGVAKKEIQTKALGCEIRQTLSDYIEDFPPPAILELLAIRTRRVLDQFLLQKGEEFASAIANSRCVTIASDGLEAIVANDFASHKDETGLGSNAVRAVRLTVIEVLQRSGPQVQRYLREIADGYTLFGFLRAVPDVQKVVQKLFSDGEIWIDTSVLLPVLAENLLDEEEQIASRLLRTAIDAGLKLRVTSGVIEEVERHINRCKTYTRTPVGQWVGGVPFLYAMHSLGGHNEERFLQWIDTFCGDQRPRDDVADYLHEEWGIQICDLHDFVSATPEKLRWEVERIWREAHEQRRASGYVDVDSYVIDRLASHDVECFLGVIKKRQASANTDLGYTHWWLTFDKTVRDFEQKLWEALGSDAPKAPVMSPDFLADYLAIGPLRARLTKQTESNLPLTMFDVLTDQVPVELIEIAGEVRKDCGTLNERLLRRRLRDTLDTIKCARGVLAKGGFAEVRANLERTLRSRMR